MLLERYLLELLLAAAQALVRLLAVVVLLHFGAYGLLVGIALHVVMESTYSELGSTH